MRLLIFFAFISIGTISQGQSLDSPAILSSDSTLSPYQHKLDSIQGNFYTQSDSLKTHFKRELSALDLSRSKMKSKIDSLQSLQLPTEKYTHKLDSITQLQEKLAGSLNQKMEDLKSKSVGKIENLNLPPELQEKVATATKNIQAFQLPVKDLNIPSLNLPGSPFTNLDGLTSSFKSPLGNIDGLGNIQETLGDVSKITEQLGGYQEDLKNITQGNLDQVKQLPETLEQKAAEIAGLDKIAKQTEALDPLLASTKNPDALKKQAIEQVQDAAIDHFAGKEQELSEAMNKISKLKKKYSSLNSLSEIPKKRPNEMRGKPLVERLLPGIGIQLLRKNYDLLTDFNPYLGYRFTGRLTGGAGWNQRVPYNFDKGTFNQLEKIYGPRIFSEFKLGKGFTPRAEIELMNTYVPVAIKPNTPDIQTQQWVFGAFIGMKKDYRLTKTIRGTAMMMLRVFNHDHKSPYADVLNVRFGFEFPMKKKQKKS